MENMQTLQCPATDTDYIKTKNKPVSDQPFEQIKTAYCNS